MQDVSSDSISSGLSDCLLFPCRASALVRQSTVSKPLLPLLSQREQEW